jgi:hypothetical protein
VRRLPTDEISFFDCIAILKMELVEKIDFSENQIHSLPSLYSNNEVWEYTINKDSVN